MLKEGHGHNIQDLRRFKVTMTIVKLSRDATTNKV